MLKLPVSHMKEVNFTNKQREWNQVTDLELNSEF